MTLDNQGNLYGFNTGTNTVTKWNAPLTASATGTTFATATGFRRNIRMDTMGNLYLCGSSANVLYKIDPTGVMTIVAGSGTAGYAGDGSAATAASVQMTNVEDVAISARNGDLYIACGGFHVRRVDGTTKIISTYAGNGGTAGTDRVAATSSGLFFPTGVALDANDNLYIADLYNYAIRFVNKVTGIITTIAGTLGGTGAQGGTSSGDLGPATSAQLSMAWGFTYDPAGMLWITCGSPANTVRMVDLTTPGNIITTVATGMYPNLAPSPSFIVIEDDDNIMFSTFLCDRSE